MKRNSLFKYLLISSLASLSIFVSACGQKKMTAQEINESIAQAKAQQEAAEKAIAESQAEQKQKEDQEKFHVKSEAEKKAEQQEELNKILKEQEQEEIDKINQLAEGKVPEDEPGLVLIPKSEDTNTETPSNPEGITPYASSQENNSEEMQAALDKLNENYDIYDIFELENGAYHTMVDAIVNNQYASLDAVYADVDKTYANYSKEIKDGLKAQLKETYDYWTTKNQEIANQPRPWTEEELAEDPDLAMFTREEVEAEMKRLEDLGCQQIKLED